MRPLPQLLDEAIGALRAGQLDLAAMLADLALRQQPRNLLALRLRADAASAAGDARTAAALLRKAVRQAPADGALHAALALALQRSGETRDARVHHRRAVALLPGEAPALANKGLFEAETGDLAAAIADLRGAWALAPGDPNVAVMYADALARASRLHEAERVLVAAERAHPQLLELKVNRADVLARMKRYQDAERLLRNLLAARPEWQMVRINLGFLLERTDRHDEAIAEYRQLLAARPDLAEAHVGLANALRRAGRHDEAEAAYREALARAPKQVETHCSLGKLLLERNRLEAAAARFRAAIDCDPRFPHAWAGLGDALGALCRVDEALAAFREAEAVSDDPAAFRDRWLLMLHYSERATPERLRAEHEEWARLVALRAPLCPLPAAARRRRPGRLRVGYVSPDFRAHSVAFFAEPVLREHDRSAFEVYAYMTGARTDEVTARIRSSVEHWRDVHDLDDADLYATLVEDDLDVLVDLAGHTSEARLRVFALQPAPVQATWIGYPNTTGLPQVRYRLTDAVADPPGVTDAHCVEQLWRLDPVFCCYLPPPAPDLSEPPSLRTGRVVFGCFNNPRKLSDRTLDVWSRLLDRVPGSTLYLKGLGLDEPSLGQAFRDRLAARGIPPDRLRIEGLRDSRADHLALYGEVDVALDPFPYNGTTTTMEALWMGVPVVALAGDRHVSRVGATLLSAAGFPEWIGRTADDYVEIAAGLARSPQRLAELRRVQRARLAATPLLDHAGFTRRLEAAYREMWERHVQALAPAAGG